MKWTVRLLSSLSALLLLFGCQPKRAFCFLPPSQSISQHPQRGAPRPVAAPCPDASLVAAAQTQPGSLPSGSQPFTAATNPEVLIPAPFSQQPHAATKAPVQPEKAAASLRKQQARLAGLQKTAGKKFNKNDRVKRPVHASAWLSSLFTLAGLVLFVVGTTGSGAYVGSYLLFSFSLLSCIAAAITGIIGMLRTNKNPDRFSGAGLARMSSIVSVFMVGMYMYGLIILLLFSQL